MIDQECRKRLAYHMRQLPVGIISNDGFECDILDDVTHGWLPEQYYRSAKAKKDDAVIVPILELCGGLYDDTRHHHLVGSDQLSPESLKIIAHCILYQYRLFCPDGQSGNSFLQHEMGKIERFEDLHCTFFDFFRHGNKNPQLMEHYFLRRHFNSIDRNYTRP